MWAAWSPASGETHILNDESAAVLEVLAEHATLTTEEVATILSVETGTDLSTLRAGIELAWIPLEWAGLVRRADSLTG